ncbi:MULTISPECIES: DoxX family protein [unclassified Dysgonomonas]|uniref:DoxX family protein n=1 Tax=unclassified Dysgonomonas TaxID=2630389 RepID=UPI0013EA958F|nr:MULTISPECIES: DoxX family protein [unclassified Dysgonomonas]
MKKIIHAVLKTAQDYKPLIPRIIVGWVFLSEGIQKYILPELVGAGRFEKIGFANPEFLAYFVGTFEIICGLLLLLGLLTKIATIPLIIIMFTALITTKLPVLLDKGFWVMAHESRTDFSMTLLLLLLLIYGAGRFSFDHFFYKKLDKR